MVQWNRLRRIRILKTKRKRLIKISTLDNKLQLILFYLVTFWAILGLFLVLLFIDLDFHKQFGSLVCNGEFYVLSYFQ